MRLAFSLIVSLLLFLLPAAADKRVTLFIGNSAYANFVALPNASTYALAMTKKLQGLGFEVVVGVDLDLETMQQRLQKFKQKLPESDIAALFYSGHGFDVRGTTFLVPVNAKLTGDADVKTQTMTLAKAMAAMSRVARVKLVFID